eukprot:gene1003-10782_t
MSKSETKEKFTLSLSNYAKKLENHVLKRYMEKIAYIGVDPMLIPDSSFDPECLPPVEATDLLSYLVLDTSYYTKTQFKAFRSLQAYNHMISGFITSVQGKVVNGKRFVVMGKVRHSQRMNVSPVPVWVITENDGTILSAHCIGCMAGLGECCSHVASMLFYLEVWTRLNGKLACTQVKCTWILPSYVKEISYSPVKDINFKSAKKLKKDLDQAVDSFKQDPEGSMNKKLICDGPTNRKDTPVSSEDDIKSLYEALSKCKVKPAALSLVHPYANSFISNSSGIATIAELFDEKYLSYQYHDLIQACSDIHVTISSEDAKQIELDTRSQAKGSGFFHHRAGRIGASMSKSASHTDPSQPSQSLIKSICYPEIFKFTNASTEYGCQHEKSAIKLFEIDMKKKHVNYKAIQCGMFINKHSPFINTTPDFLSTCDCCGSGCGEVKCPYCIESIDFEGYLENPSSCLVKDLDGKVILKKSHQYFYQVRQQMFTTELPFCDFVVFGFEASQSAFIHERITPDQDHWDRVLPRLSQFWQYCVLPEILGRWYTRKCYLSKPQLNSGTKICFCGEETGEATVKCQIVDCPILFYHPLCLKVTEFSNNWYCPHCQRLPDFKRQPKAK